MKRMWFDLCFYIGTIALGGLRRENDVAEEDQEDFEEDHARASSKKIDWTAFQTPLRPSLISSALFHVPLKKWERVW